MDGHGQYARLFCAIVTPFKPGTEEIDERAWRSLLRYFGQPRFVAAGGALIVSPEAGEAFYLTEQEKCRLAEIALEEVGDRMPVFCGVIQPTTAACIREAKALKMVGVHGVFLLPPMGAMDVTVAWMPEKYPEVWIDMARAICDAVDLPAIAHPVAGRHPFYGQGFPLEATLSMLDAVPQIIGWKMTYPWPAYRVVAEALRNYKRRQVAVLAANGTMFHEALAYGYFDGTASGFWNYAMEPMVDHIEAWRAGDVERAKRILTGGLLQLHDYVAGIPGDQRLHSAYKAAAWLRGLIPDPFMRAPQRRLRTTEVRRLWELLQAAHLEVIGVAEIRKAYPDF